MLYVSADIKPFIEKNEVQVHVYKSIKQSYIETLKHYHAIEKSWIRIC